MGESRGGRIGGFGVGSRVVGVRRGSVRRVEVLLLVVVLEGEEWIGQCGFSPLGLRK